ncbi:MAG TPA: hypothetical protein VKV77_03290 [Methylovirgula sp.]|nr:hypothetical protein [Methylovirgula sp.]
MKRKHLPLVASALIASAALQMFPGTQAFAWTRALNPQPLPPGLYSPWHSGRIMLNPQPLPPGLYAPGHPAAMTTAYPKYSGRHVCVAWGRVCTKVGEGSPTHEAPCGQYVYVCRKYG